MDGWLFYNALDHIEELERRETPLRCVLIELTLSTILMVGGLAFVACWLWRAGFRLY